MSGTSDPVVRRLDGLLRQSPNALAWLTENWLDADVSVAA
jgi:hypothetical protein